MGVAVDTLAADVSAQAFRRARLQVLAPRAKRHVPSKMKHEIRPDEIETVDGEQGGKCGNHNRERSIESVDAMYKVAAEENVTQKDVVRVFAEILTAMVERNDALIRDPDVELDQALRDFHGRKIPKVSLGWYIWRIVYVLNKYPKVETTHFAEDIEYTVKNATSSPGAKVDPVNEDSLSRGLRSFLLAMVYIDRITTKHPGFILSSFSIHRVLLTAILCAAKFSDDFTLDIDVFAEVGGIPLSHMGRMELRMCSLINYEFTLGEEEFTSKCINNLTVAFEIALQRKQKDAQR
eukprot:CAMPEP_0203788890 /NCGR_PEP_ID=MMETSP0100_2-20121128/3110_1 /ASSEMBLY_ACC=CAM_ASM_000210 /TAXON_ID=96639 /ORGANISM=" , Strain NY0313808BC1" /LENGTH=292 /DNA_ID=CAMNT_0050691707 /DNA_START=729 /DNA_END=1607 /DNA_ORIENTATION=+